jgi:hypothetical protein
MISADIVSGGFRESLPLRRIDCLLGRPSGERVLRDRLEAYATILPGGGITPSKRRHGSFDFRGLVYARARGQTYPPRFSDQVEAGPKFPTCREPGKSFANRVASLQNRAILVFQSKRGVEQSGSSSGS